MFCKVYYSLQLLGVPASEYYNEMIMCPSYVGLNGHLHSNHNIYYNTYDLQL